VLTITHAASFTT